MTREEMFDGLNSLIQLDIDGASAYDQAIKNIDDPIIKARFLDFKGITRATSGIFPPWSKKWEGPHPIPPLISKAFSFKDLRRFAARPEPREPCGLWS